MKRISVHIGILLILLVGMILVMPKLLEPPSLKVPLHWSEDVFPIYEEGTASLEFTLPMRKATVEEAIAITPDIPYHLSWSGRTVTITFGSEINTGDYLTVSISASATSLFGKSLSQPLERSYQVTESPTVIMSVPTGRNVSPESPILVLFSDALLNEGYEQAPVPSITIIPKTEGSWKWMGKRSLQFFPALGRLKMSTAYEISIPSRTQNNSTEDYKWSFITDRIKLNEPVEETKMNVQEPWRIDFTQEVNLASAKEKIQLTTQGSPVPISVSYAVNKDGNIDNKKSLNIMPKNLWSSSTVYNVSIAKGILGMEGNRGTEEEVTRQLITDDVVAVIFPVENEPIIGTHSPLELQFSEPMNLPSLKRALSTMPPHPFQLGYKTNEEGNPVKTNVLVVFTNPLEYSSSVQLVVKKDLKTESGRLPLDADAILRLHTSDPLEVEVLPLDSIPNYKGFCIASSNPLDESQSQVSFSPSSDKPITMSSSSDLIKHCESDGKKYLLVAETLLPSNTELSVSTHLLKDRYGQNPKNPRTVQLKTEALKNSDKNFTLEKAFSWSTSNVPNEAQPRVRSTNVSELQTSLCKLTPEDIIHIESASEKGWADFSPSESTCLSLKRSTIPIQHEEWREQTTQLEILTTLEQWGKGIYFIEVTSPGVRSEDGSAKKEWRLIQITNLHLVSKSGDNTLIWLTNLSTGEGIEGAQVRFYSASGSLMKQVKTMRQGLYSTNVRNLNYETVVAKTTSDQILVKSFWQDGLTSLEQGFEGDWSDEVRMVGALFTDRKTVLRGEPINYFGVVRREANARLSLTRNQNINVTVIDPLERQVYRKFHTVNEFGVFKGEVSLPNDTPEGPYQVRLCIGYFEELCSGTEEIEMVWVSDRKEPLINISIKSSQNSVHEGSVATAIVAATFRNGAPLENETLEWRWLREDRSGMPTVMERQRCEVKCREEVEQGATPLPQNGEITLQQRVTNNVARKSEANLILSVAVKNQGELLGMGTYAWNIEDQSERIEIDAPRHQISPDTAFKVDITVTDKEKEAEAGEYIAFRVVRLPDQSREVLRETLRTNQKGLASTSITLTEPGIYNMTAQVQTANGAVIERQQEITVGSEITQDSPVRFPSRIEIETDKEEYESGDEMNLTIKTPFEQGKLLITLERGGIIKSHIAQVKNFRSEWQATVTEEMIPVFYITAMMNAAVNSTPLAYGVRMVEVSPTAKELTVELSRENGSSSEGGRDDFKVRLLNAQGKPVEAWINAKIESESGTTVPDAWEEGMTKKMVAPRGLKVNTADSLTTWEKKPPSLLPRSTDDKEPLLVSDFEPGFPTSLALWHQTFTNEKGEAVIPIPRLDASKNWMLTLQAVGKLDEFGTRRVPLQEKSNLLLQLYVPEILRTNDKAWIHTQLTNASSGDRNVRVSAKASHLNFLSPSQMILGVPAGQTVPVSFFVQARATHSPRADLFLEASSMETKIEKSASIHILETRDREEHTTVRDIAKSEIIRISTLLPSARQNEQITIEVGANHLPLKKWYWHRILASGEEDVVTSAAKLYVMKTAWDMSVEKSLQLRELLPAITDPKGETIMIETAMQRVIGSLITTQHPDGGWGIWTNSKMSSPQTTAEVIEVLSEKSDMNAELFRAIEQARRYVKSMNQVLSESKNERTLALEQFLNNGVMKATEKMDNRSALEQVRMLRALNKLTVEIPLSQPVNVRLSTATGGIKELTISDERLLWQVTLSPRDVQDSTVWFTFQPNQEPYPPITLVLKSNIQSVEDLRGEESGMMIQREYRMDESERSRKIIREGDVLRGKISLYIPSLKKGILVESPIPAGFELINFMEENKEEETCEECREKTRKAESLVFNSVELRADRLVLTADELPRGIYNYHFAVRARVEGEFYQPPATIMEISNPKNFAGTEGEIIVVEQR